MIDSHRRQSFGALLKLLVGSGDRIMLTALPFLVVGVILNAWYPAVFAVGGPPFVLLVVSIAVLSTGLVIWAWSVYLILTRVPRGDLITSGPYALMKHPIYAGVALLVVPWGGFLLNTWLGALLGAVLYIATRRFAPEEERQLAQTFGATWDAYCHRVMLPSLQSARCAARHRVAPRPPRSAQRTVRVPQAGVPAVARMAVRGDADGVMHCRDRH